MHSGRGVETLLIACAWAIAAHQLYAQAAADTGRISLAPSPPSVPHGMTLDEITAMKTVHELAVSPNGDRIAFVVRQAFRDSDTYRSALFLVDTTPGAVPYKVVEETEIKRLLWMPDGRSLAYICQRDAGWQLCSVPARPHSTAVALIRHAPGSLRNLPFAYANEFDHQGPAEVLSYAIAPDDRYIAFTVPADPTPDYQRDRLQRGIRYDDSAGVATITEQTWFRDSLQLWIADLNDHTEHRVLSTGSEIGDMEWSPDSKRLVFDWSAPANTGNALDTYKHDIAVLTIASGEVTTIGSRPTSYSWHAVWSPDGQFVAFSAIPNGDPSVTEGRASIAVVDTRTGQRRDLGVGRVDGHQRLWWTDTAHLVVEGVDDRDHELKGRPTLYSMDIGTDSMRRVAARPERLEDCAYNAAAGRAVCAHEESMTPPEIALINTQAGALRIAVDVNPQLRNIRLGDVSAIRWTNAYGLSTDGYLLKPVDFRSGKRYPLVVVLYGFDGRFVSQAEWISSCPAQTLAADGFVVLMVNQPSSSERRRPGMTAGQFSEGYNTLASVEAGVRLLATQGIADSTKTGLLGWSYGAFVAEFTMTHSHHQFRAFSVGDGGDYNPGAFWVSGTVLARLWYAGVMGGPPYGATLKHWLPFSPAFNAARVRAPLLMTFSAVEATFALEMYTALKTLNKPVELVIYPDEGHIFHTPAHRYYSMLGNLKWFEFWLQGRTAPSSDDGDQYARWRAMRQQLRGDTARVTSHSGVATASP